MFASSGKLNNVRRGQNGSIKPYFAAALFCDLACFLIATAAVAIARSDVSVVGINRESAMKATGTAKGTATATGVMRLKTGFAINHLQAAARAARDAYDVEQANATADFGRWFDEMMRLVPVSVVMAAAALEANANELIQEILDGSVHSKLPASRKELLKDLKDDHSGNAWDRYRRFALVMDKEPDKGTEPWRNARLLLV